MALDDFELLYGNDNKIFESALTAAMVFTTGPVAKVFSIDGLSGVLTLADLNLDEIDNTSDMDKPVSTAVQSALDNVVDIGNVLTLDNTTAFTPDSDYEPATYKFTIDQINNINHDGLIGFSLNEHIDWLQPNVGTIDPTNYVSHPDHTPRASSFDTGALTGKNVISDLNIIFNSDSLGHITNANFTHDTRELELSDLGFTGNVNADYYSFFGIQSDGGTVESVLSEENINFISGNNITVTNTGKNVTIATDNLPIALDAVLGGVKSGTEVSVDSGTGEMSIVNLGLANGVATLNSSGEVPSDQLPGAWGTIYEYADMTALLANGDGNGENENATYITLDDDHSFKWTGTQYIDITGSGVDSVAGATGVVTLANIGLENVTNKSEANLAISTATQTALDGKVDENANITAGTHTKLTYDVKGLVTSGSDATTADIAASTDKNYVTDAELTDVGLISGFDPSDYSTTGTDINYVATVGGNDVLRDLDALSTVTDTNQLVTEDDIAGFGGGDMLSIAYDTGIWNGTNSVDNARTVGNNGGAGFTIESNVPSTAIFGYEPATPGTDGTDGIDGLLTDADKFKLDSIESSAQVNTVELDANNVFTKAQRGDRSSIYINGGSPVIGFNASNRHELTLTEDVAFAEPIEVNAGQGGVIYLIQDSTGGWNITSWDSKFVFLNDYPTTGSANEIHIYSYEIFSADKIIMSFAGII